MIISHGMLHERMDFNSENLKYGYIKYEQFLIDKMNQIVRKLRD